MSSSPRAFEAQLAGGECEAGPPVLIAVEHVPASARERLQELATRSACRLFAPTDGPGGSFVLSGYPEALGSLRSALVAFPELDLVRERLERELARFASPEGLPQLRESDQKCREIAEEMQVPAGTKLRVSREFTFDAAHNLPRYNGKCERLHGHTFRLLVTLEAPLDTWSGMAFDFSDVKSVVKQRVLDVLDHAYLNEIVPNPSAEFLAVWIWQKLGDLPLHEIKVWETPNCSVTYHGPPKESPADAR